MKKYFSFSLFLCVFSLVFGVFAETSMAQQSGGISATVQVKSYVATRNGVVFPEVQGSGTFLQSDGLILTNNHVVEREKDTVYDGFVICISRDPNAEPECEYTASLIARNREMDLALLQVDAEDIRGNAIPQFPFLSYTDTPAVQEGDAVEIVGFPGIGLETITFTAGTVSGFQEINEFRYIKTDTIIAPGNSGGTALSSDARFIGVPTYGVSTLGSSLGYFLDIAEAVEWITAQKEGQPDVRPEIQQAIAERMTVINDAKASHRYTAPFAPRFEIAIPEDWKFADIERDLIIMNSENEIKRSQLVISLSEFPFPLTEEYLYQTVFRKIERNKENYTDYQRTEISFRDMAGFRITYLLGDSKSITDIVPYGDTLFVFSYAYELSEEAEAQAEYDAILDTFQFLDEPQAGSTAEEFTNTEPPFSVNTPSGWYLHKNTDPYQEDLILRFLRPENPEGEMAISYMDLSESNQYISNEEFLRQILENHEFTPDFRLVKSKSDVVVSGLSGVMLTYTYEGEEFGQTRKISKVYLRDGEQVYFIRYDDLKDAYEKNLFSFERLLASFTNTDPNATEADQYDIGSFEGVFLDIAYHRYEQAISRLADQNIVNGFSDKTFRPERSVSRAEALKMLLEAKVISDEKKNDFTLQTKLTQQERVPLTTLFSDVQEFGWAEKYLSYAKNTGIVEGYTDGTFRPEQTVSIAEACKMLFHLYEIPVWDRENNLFSRTTPWHKPYMDKGFALGIIPYGIYEPEHALTRGEFSFFLSEFLEQREQ